MDSDSFPELMADIKRSVIEAEEVLRKIQNNDHQLTKRINNLELKCQEDVLGITESIMDLKLELKNTLRRFDELSDDQRKTSDKLSALSEHHEQLAKRVESNQTFNERSSSHELSHIVITTDRIGDNSSSTPATSVSDHRTSDPGYQSTCEYTQGTYRGAHSSEDLWQQRHSGISDVTGDQSAYVDENGQPSIKTGRESGSELYRNVQREIVRKLLNAERRFCDGICDLLARRRASSQQIIDRNWNFPELVAIYERHCIFLHQLQMCDGNRFNRLAELFATHFQKSAFLANAYVNYAVILARIMRSSNAEPNKLDARLYWPIERIHQYMGVLRKILVISPDHERDGMTYALDCLQSICETINHFLEAENDEHYGNQGRRRSMADKEVYSQNSTSGAAAIIRKLKRQHLNSVARPVSPPYIASVSQEDEDDTDSKYETQQRTTQIVSEDKERLHTAGSASSITVLLKERAAKEETTSETLEPGQTGRSREERGQQRGVRRRRAEKSKQHSRSETDLTNCAELLNASRSQSSVFNSSEMPAEYRQRQPSGASGRTSPNVVFPLYYTKAGTTDSGVVSGTAMSVSSHGYRRAPEAKSAKSKSAALRDFFIKKRKSPASKNRQAPPAPSPRPSEPEVAPSWVGGTFSSDGSSVISGSRHPPRLLAGSIPRPHLIVRSSRGGRVYDDDDDNCGDFRHQSQSEWGNYSGRMAVTVSPLHR